MIPDSSTATTKNDSFEQIQAWMKKEHALNQTELKYIDISKVNAIVSSSLPLPSQIAGIPPGKMDIFWEDLDRNQKSEIQEYQDALDKAIGLDKTEEKQIQEKLWSPMLSGGLGWGASFAILKYASVKGLVVAGFVASSPAILLASAAFGGVMLWQQNKRNAQILDREGGINRRRWIMNTSDQEKKRFDLLTAALKARRETLVAQIAEDEKEGEFDKNDQQEIEYVNRVLISMGIKIPGQKE